MSIVKVPQNELPKTITAGLDPSYDPNPNCLPVPYDWWGIAFSGKYVADSDTPNGWDVAESGVISIPELGSSQYGVYEVEYHGDYGGACGGSLTLVTYYIFKIVPPCPTVTMSAS